MVRGLNIYHNFFSIDYYFLICINERKQANSNCSFCMDFTPEEGKRMNMKQANTKTY